MLSLHLQSPCYIESGLKLPGLDLASLATQGVGAEAQPNAYTGYGISADGCVFCPALAFPLVSC